MTGHLGSCRFYYRDDHYVDTGSMLESLGKDEKDLFLFLASDDARGIMARILEDGLYLPVREDGRDLWMQVERKGRRDIYWLHPTLATAYMMRPVFKKIMDKLNTGTWNLQTGNQ